MATNNKSASSMAKRLIEAAGKGSRATMLADSEYLETTTLCSTDVPIVNLMMDGDFDGGVTPGIVIVVGDSRTFKTAFCALSVKAYLDKYEDAICVFFDSEFGGAKLLAAYGIDPNRVIHIPVENLEELDHQTVKMLNEIQAGERVIFFTDSISQIASIREMENSLEGNGAKDMSRAAAMNSFFRKITPMLNIRKIASYYINSYYDDVGNKYAEKIIKGGKQLFLSANSIFLVTRSQETEGTGAAKELVGWNFNYTVIKSRTIIEKSKFSLEVRYDSGINKYSGIFELAMESGYLTMPKSGWYVWNKALTGFDDTKFIRKSDLDSYYPELLKNKDFKDWVKRTYTLGGSGVKLLGNEEPIIDEETGEVLNAQPAQ